MVRIVEEAQDSEEREKPIHSEMEVIKQQLEVCKVSVTVSS